jgi:hypothetical protein
LADLQQAVRLFPFSESVLSQCMALAEQNADPAMLQILFEDLAHAYSVDKYNPAIRTAYISAARKLNLDFFADEAEQKE